MFVHYWYIKKVLKQLCKADLYTKVEKANFYTKIEKCEFYSKLVEYLEYILSFSRLIMFNNKVMIIQDWLKSNKFKNIQSFLDFANFYYQFIFNYLDIVILLIYLIQKNILQKLDNFCYNVFNFLKKAFTSTSIFMHYISNIQLIMKMDTSNYILTIILFIINENNKFYTVIFLLLDFYLHKAGL